MTLVHDSGAPSSAPLPRRADGIGTELRKVRKIETTGELVMGGNGEEPDHVMKPKHRNLPKGLRLLVVEDNMIVALDVEDMLKRNGATHVEVVNTAEEALKQLDAAVFDAALLDLKLTDGDSLPVAARLRELAIPFAFSTGYGERADIPSPFAGLPVIGKPYSESYLLSCLADLLDASD
jgi:CheY-like chemotaxis protein